MRYIYTARWMLKNPEKDKEIKERFQKLNPWAKHFYCAKSRVKVKTKKNNCYNRLTFTLTMAQIKEVYIRDQAQLLTQPSLDRIDTNQGYTVDNIRFIELSENLKRKKRDKLLINFDSHKKE